jgi:hypothetical protein
VNCVEEEIDDAKGNTFSLAFSGRTNPTIKPRAMKNHKVKSEVAELGGMDLQVRVQVQNREFEF